MSFPALLRALCVDDDARFASALMSRPAFFDALLLAVRDWPSAHPYRGGEDFIVGAEGIVPRAMWPGKPANVRPGSWFRQVYEPTHPNGWPLGAVGDWYLNFGLLGVLVGGGLSGLLYRVLMATWWRVPWSSFNVAALMCIVAFVVPTGIDALTLLHWVQWGFPLLLCAGFINRRSQSRARRPELVARTGGSPTTP